VFSKKFQKATHPLNKQASTLNTMTEIKQVLDEETRNKLVAIFEMFDGDRSGALEVHIPQSPQFYPHSFLDKRWTYKTSNSSYIITPELESLLHTCGYKFSPKNVAYKDPHLIFMLSQTFS